jgi:hypothetical protein
VGGLSESDREVCREAPDGHFAGGADSLKPDSVVSVIFQLDRQGNGIAGDAGSFVDVDGHLPGKDSIDPDIERGSTGHGVPLDEGSFGIDGS